jgi:hypothetical protein
MARCIAPIRAGWLRGVAPLGLVALALAMPLAGPAAARATLKATRTADDLPIPPTPSRAPSSAAPGCSKDEQAAKAARLIALLQDLIQRDPARAKQLLNSFQTTVQRAEQHQIDPGQACRAYDGLISQAGG